MLLALVTLAWGWPSAEEGAQPTATRLGRVVQTFDSGGFTYVQLDVDGSDVWIAGPPTRIAVGDLLATSEGVLMADFHSRTLNRTFERIWFVASWRDMGVAPVPVEDAPVPRVAGALTVADVLARAAALRGTEVQVAGRVTRVAAGILGRNWVHVQDGTAHDGQHDLTFTTLATVESGAMVLIRGRVATDKDFGAGYHYAVLLEDAQVQPLPQATP
jgi:hypothetical protein